MTFNFDGKMVELTTEQMHEVYRAYMENYIVRTLTEEEMLAMLSEYADQYTDDDKQKLSESIDDLMESDTLQEDFYDYVGECLGKYDEKFWKCEDE